MLWEVTGYRRADPVRHYETEDLDLFIVQIYYNYAKVQLKGGSTKKKVLFIMIVSNHGNYGTIGISSPSITTNIHIVPNFCNYFVSLTFCQDRLHLGIQKSQA